MSRPMDIVAKVRRLGCFVVAVFRIAQNAATSSCTRISAIVDKPFNAYARRSPALVNDCDLLAGFCYFYLPFSHLTPNEGNPFELSGLYLVWEI